MGVSILAGEPLYRILLTLLHNIYIGIALRFDAIFIKNSIEHYENN